MNAERVANLVGNLDQIFFIVLRYDDRVDAEAMRRKYLLLHAADRQHLATQGDLTGHRHVSLDRDSRQCRRHRGGHRDSSRRTIFWYGAFRNMDVQVALANEVETHSESLRASADASQSSLSRFLHHVAEFSGKRHAATSFNQRGFNLKHFAADFGPGQARSQPDLTLRRNALLAKFNRSQHFAK